MDPAGGNEEDVVGISGFGMFGAPSLPGSGISSYRDPTDLGALSNWGRSQIDVQLTRTDSYRIASDAKCSKNPVGDCEHILGQTDGAMQIENVENCIRQRAEPSNVTQRGGHWDLQNLLFEEGRLDALSV